MLGTTYGVTLMLMFVVSNASAEEVLPARCTSLLVSGDLVVLPAAKSMITMIHNLSTNDLWITHPVTDPSASAGWSSHLQAGNWSALVLDGKELELSCIESKPGHEQQVACSTVVAVCQWTATAFPGKSLGTYWAGEDMLLSPLIAFIKRHGFVLSAHASEPAQ